MTVAHAERLTPGLIARLVLRLVFGTAVMACTLFALAWSWAYWPGWVYLAVLLLPVYAGIAFFAWTDPALLRERMRMQEERSAQVTAVALIYVVFVVGFLLPGLDYRFGWSRLPPPVWLGANVVVLAANLFVLWVLRVNSYAARTVQVQAVIDDGPYAVVRHPIYAGILVMMLATPVALGSLFALPPFLLLPFALVLRIRDEEKLLEEELAGYADYRKKVRWRLVPGIW